jgi:hypothetical protein
MYIGRLTLVVVVFDGGDGCGLSLWCGTARYLVKVESPVVDISRFPIVVLLASSRVLLMARLCRYAVSCLKLVVSLSSIFF